MSYDKRVDRVAQVAGHLNFPKGMLAGQVAIITGSGQGIGAEAARMFANEGAKVVVSDIDSSKYSHCGYHERETDGPCRKSRGSRKDNQRKRW